MKIIKLAMVMLALMVTLPVVGQRRPHVKRQKLIFKSAKDTTGVKVESYTISPNTTKIEYHHHANSGIAIYTTYVITEDSLVWQYQEARNNCFLTDVCRYEKGDFDAMLKSMATLSITVTTKPYRPGYGGAGWSYSFSDAENKYLYYSNDSKIDGNNKEIDNLIQNFIQSHMTEAELLFNKLRFDPHERGEYGTFKELPDELKKYSKR